MRKAFAIAILLAGCLSAADFSGTWNGRGGQQSQKYGLVPHTAQMTIVQSGSTFTGSLKVDNGKVMKIGSGSVSGTNVIFVLSNAASQITANLAQSGAQLVGKMTSSAGVTYSFVFTKK